MTPGEELHCPSCGYVLARVVSERVIATDQGEFSFSRRTDHIICDDCGDLIPVRELRGDDAERGEVLELLHELAVDEDPPAGSDA